MAVLDATVDIQVVPPSSLNCIGKLKLSLSNIVAIALLSGSPNCPPVADAVILEKITPAISQNPPMSQIADQSQLPVQVGFDDGLTLPDTLSTDTAVPISDEALDEILDTDAGPLLSPIAPADDAQNTIVVTARQGPPRGDPAEAVNEVAFGAAQSVDNAFAAPVARAYERGVPEPLRDGLQNFLNNLNEPIVFLNFLLQFKFGKAFETVGRFAVNSTIGAAGLFDVAKKQPFALPRRSNGLANTLGFYGVGPGPYLYLPLIGSTTVRDLFGQVVDLSLLPTAVGPPLTSPAVSSSRGVVSSVIERVEKDEIFTRVQQSGNPYAAMREYYLKKREAEIDVLKGKRCNADINLNELEFMDSLPETSGDSTEHGYVPGSAAVPRK